jgi:hypothetical protein
MGNLREPLWGSFASCAPISSALFERATQYQEAG